VSAAEVIHPVPADEVGPWLASMVETFLDPAPIDAADTTARAALWQPERSWGARADGRWVATLRTDARRITVPGTTAHTPREIAADALTNVTVAATHRRLGLMSTMLSEALAGAKDRGDPVSVLVAAEWPIYGRFGFAPTSDAARYTVRPRTRGARLLAPVSGSVRPVGLEEFAALAPPIFAAARQQRAGDIDRPSSVWDRRLGRGGFPPGKQTVVFIVHEGVDGPDGFVSWESTGHWSLTEELGQISVHDLIAANDVAYAALWDYLLGIDVIEQIHLYDRPVDEPLRWLLVDGRAIRQTHRVDWMWLRLLDVAAALSARCYATDDSLVLEVVDADGPGYAAGRYQLEGGPAGAQCQPTTRSADLVVQQRALAAAYLGGTSLLSQLPAGLVSEQTTGALARADAMLSTSLPPWCATSF
jgi:predicted acetyltransferase